MWNLLALKRFMQVKISLSFYFITNNRINYLNQNRVLKNIGFDIVWANLEIKFAKLDVVLFDCSSEIENYWPQISILFID